MPGYNTLVTKHDQLNRHMHRLGIYTKLGLPCARDPRYEVSDQPFMCIRVALVHTTAYIFFLYRPSNDNLAVVNNISDKIDQLLTENPSASIHLCGDFNVHNKDWLTFSNKITREGLECQNFAIAHNLTQLIDFPTRIPDVEDHFQSLLDLFLTSCSEQCQACPCSPLGRSDHLVVEININMPPNESTDVPFHRTVYRYNNADWDSFRSHLAETPKAYFKHRASKTAQLVSDWIYAGIESFVPHKKYKLKPHSQP